MDIGPPGVEWIVSNKWDVYLLLGDAILVCLKSYIITLLFRDQINPCRLSLKSQQTKQAVSSVNVISKFHPLLITAKDSNVFVLMILPR